MSSNELPSWHGTTILTVRKAGRVVIAGDGQVSLGATIIKANARKVRTVGKGGVIGGFAGATADAFALLERFEAKLKDFPANVPRAATELAKEWRTDRVLRRLEAMMAVVANKGNSLVLAVTILTSLDDDTVQLIYGGPSRAKVLQLARDACLAGADGVICSPQELEMLGTHPELARLLKVTPGVRPEWAAVGDQKRVMTPGEAIKKGATALVIGRPITQPPPSIASPADAARIIADEIDVALATLASS